MITISPVRPHARSPVRTHMFSFALNGTHFVKMFVIGNSNINGYGNDMIISTTPRAHGSARRIDGTATTRYFRAAGGGPCTRRAAQHALIRVPVWVHAFHRANRLDMQIKRWRDRRETDQRSACPAPSTTGCCSAGCTLDTDKPEQ